MNQKEESFYDFNELFFSKTDKKGIIKNGNDVFIRVSQFSKEDLMGAPHNIIRHPDMPKAVFKLLWDTILNQKPISAYVKNKSKNGLYYWVVASVFPYNDEFISIRFKPSSQLLPIVENLYTTVLIEDKRNMNDSLNTIVKTINQLGFKDYYSFMSTVVVSELQSRDEILSKRNFEYPFVLSELNESNEKSTKIFYALIKFNQYCKEIETYSKSVISKFENLNNISLNMAIAAEKTGDEGRSLSEISKNFKNVSMDIERTMKEVIQFIDNIVINIQTSQYEICSVRLQIETLMNYLSGQNEKDMQFRDNYESLIQLAKQYIEIIQKKFFELLNIIQGLTKRTETLLSEINGMHVIRISGKIEIAKINPEYSTAFKNHLQEIENFIAAIYKPLKDEYDLFTKFSNELSVVTKYIQEINSNISRIDLNTITNNKKATL